MNTRSRGGMIRRMLASVIGMVALLSLIGCATKTAAPPAATPTPAHGASATGSPSSPVRPPASTKPSSAAGGQTDPESGLKFLDASALPKEARDTMTLIDKGGPFPYDKDGVVFGNAEGVLPKKPRGYYKEYTVPTPGSRDRGARRIVTGDHDKLFFYTDDHYKTFSRIRR